MSKSAEAWMPFYVGDYLGDTQRLTTEQHGAYLLLILDYWRNGPAPDDDAVLMSITRLDRKAWKAHRPALSRMFQITDSEWRHKRIEHEIENAKANQERRSSKASKAAQARWGDAPKGPTSTPPSNAPSMPQALHEGCPPPSPSPEITDDKSSSISESADAPAKPSAVERLKRGSAMPSNFEPHLTADAQAVVDAWPSGTFERELAQWRDHHIAKGTLAKDWQASLRTWLRNAEQFRINRNGRQLSLVESDPKLAGLGVTARAAIRAFGPD